MLAHPEWSFAGLVYFILAIMVGFSWFAIIDKPTKLEVTAAFAVGIFWPVSIVLAGILVALDFWKARRA